MKSEHIAWALAVVALIGWIYTAKNPPPPPKAEPPRRASFEVTEKPLSEHEIFRIISMGEDDIEMLRTHCYLYSNLRTNQNTLSCPKNQ